MATAEEIYRRDLAFDKDFIKTPTGDLDTQAGVKNYRDALFRRLITTPGSLVHRPNYGVGIKGFRNSMATLATKQRIARIIKQQFEEDPRTVEVGAVGVEVDDLTPELTKIHVRVQAVAYGELQLEFAPFEGV